MYSRKSAVISSIQYRYEIYGTLFKTETQLLKLRFQEHKATTFGLYIKRKPYFKSTDHFYRNYTGYSIQSAAITDSCIAHNLIYF